MTAQPLETPADRIRRRLTAIAREHGLTLQQMMSKQRFREFVAARRAAYCYLFHEEGWSTTQIGRHFKRDHTTVVWALDNLGTKSQRLDKMRSRMRDKAKVDPWAKKLGARTYDQPSAVPQPATPKTAPTATQGPANGISQRGGKP